MDGRSGSFKLGARRVCLFIKDTSLDRHGRKTRVWTDLHVLGLALQRELQLADDGVLLPQRSVQVVLHVLLGPLQVLQSVRQMLQLHVLLFDRGVETLEGAERFKLERLRLCDPCQTKKNTTIRRAYVDGLLAVGEQVVEPLKVALPLSEAQLQLVDLVVLLLDGGELLIQRLLRAAKCRGESQSAVTLPGGGETGRFSPETRRRTSRAFSFSFNLCRSLESTPSLPPGLLFCSKSRTMFMYS